MLPKVHDVSQDTGSSMRGSALALLSLINVGNDIALDPKQAGDMELLEGWFDQKWALFKDPNEELFISAGSSAATTGTTTASITESDIVAGGKTIILTLTITGAVDSVLNRLRVMMGIGQ